MSSYIIWFCEIRFSKNFFLIFWDFQAGRASPSSSRTSSSTSACGSRGLSGFFPRFFLVLEEDPIVIVLQKMVVRRFENDRTISFIPPDGAFELMSYRLVSVSIFLVQQLLFGSSRKIMGI